MSYSKLEIVHNIFQKISNLYKLGENEILDPSSGDPNQAVRQIEKSYHTDFELHELFPRNNNN